VSSSNPRVNVPSLRCPRHTAGVVLLPPRGINLDTWLSDPPPPAGAGDQDTWAHTSLPWGFWVNEAIKITLMR